MALVLAWERIASTAEELVVKPPALFKLCIAGRVIQ